MTTISSDVQFPTLPDVIDAGRVALAPEVREWIEGGTSGEQSLTANRAAFDRWYFARDMLSGAGSVDLSSELFGMRVSMPIFISPFGSDGAMHVERYLGVARALAATGNTSIIAQTSSDSLEAIADACAGQQGMVQLGLRGSEEVLLEHANRAADAGYRGICFTAGGSNFWRERRLRTGIDLSQYSGVGSKSVVSRGRPVSDSPRRPWTWEHLAALSGRLRLPWILKGVLSAEQACRALDAGASGVYVSNFGGRNLDGLPPTIDVLGEVVEAVDGRVPVLIDSGFRRGTDVVKALALGATAVGFGRVGAWSLAAGGERGVRAMLDLLHGELTSVLSCLGVERPGDLARRHVHRR